MAFDKRKALQAALTYTQQGKWDKAIAEYQTILKADPHDLTVCNNLGDLYARAGKAGDAIEQYLKLGELYRADGLSVKAIAVYKKIIKLDSNRTQALLACADLYEEQGLTGEAKIQLVLAAEQSGKAGDAPKVIEIYQRLTALDQTNHTLLTKLADLLLKAGKRAEAAAQYELAAQASEAAGLAPETKRLRAKLRELTPESPQVNLTQVEQFLREGKHAEAVDALLKATAGDHTNGQAWRLLGEAYIGLGQAPEAIRALEQAVGSGLPEEEVRHLLAKALVLEGHTEEGITLCQKLTEDALARNNPEEAITICQEIVALAPNLAPVHLSLVKLLKELGRRDEARAATWALAAAHEACGETESAIHVYHQLLEDDPSDAEAKARLEVLEGQPVPSGVPEDLSLLAQEAASAAEAEPIALEEPAPVEEAPAEQAQAEAQPTQPAWEELAPAEVAPPGAAPEEPAAAELSATEPPALELSPDEALTPGDLSALGLGEGNEPEAQPTQVFELDESGELAGMRYPSQKSQAPTMGGPAGLEGSAIEFPGEGSGEDAPAQETLEGEEEAPGEVAELLAEAEVYLKYGLTDKARERLLEVVRLTPGNLTAHRRLKALYLDRPQSEEACGESLAIARILKARGQLDAARRELQEGLRRAPRNAALQAMLAELSGALQSTEAAVAAQTALPASAPAESGFPDAFEIPESLAGEGEVAQDLTTDAALPEGAGFAETPPPDALPSESPQAFDLPNLGGEPTSTEEELPPELQTLLEEPSEAPAAAVAAVETNVDQAMAEDLAEAEFYLSQDMMQEARAVHRRMLTRQATHPAVAQLGNQIEPSKADLAGEPISPELPGPDAMTSFAGLLEDAEPEAAADLPANALDFLPEMPPEVASAAESHAAGAATQTSPDAAEPPREPAEQPPLASPSLSSQTPTSDMGSAKFSVMQGGGEGAPDSFVNLGAELVEELAEEERVASPGSSPPQVEDLIREFQKGVRENLDEKDFETHYNLGIAYKEMELYDEAIQEFRLARRDPARALPCAHLSGLCAVAKGDLGAAIQEFRAGLDVRGHPPESYNDLRYDLGVAYETNGDLEQALETFESLQANDQRFRDVSARVQDLRERVPRPQVASLPTSAAGPADTGKRAKGKKISFI